MIDYMVPWWWLIIVAITGACVGFVVSAIFTISKISQMMDDLNK